MFNIVLFQPEIPQNTGNIVRTCAVAGAALHLIKPYGFIINEKNIRRAGLDYWDYADITEYDDFDAFLSANKNAVIYPVTTKSERAFTDFKYGENDFFLFGQETSGLPAYIHQLFWERRIRIPMRDSEHARCLNLANAVNIVLYEALRQNDFFGMV